MHRAYCKDLNISSKQTSITDKEEIHHIKNVLRLKEKEKLTIFNGVDIEALCHIKSINSKEILVSIIDSKHILVKKPSIILACAMPKKSKFETIIEKATELGADRIIPLKTHRTEVNVKAEKQEKKISRFQTVALNAAKQSKRVSLPAISNIMSLEEAFNSLDKTTIKIIPSLQKDTKILTDTLNESRNSKTIAFFIGPEGDFTDEEYKLAHDQKCIPVTLGETILKVETAALCVMSCANIFLKNQ